MPRFYFNPLDGEDRIDDPEGSELPDLDAAHREALHVARELWAAAMREGRDLGLHSLEITDEAGRLLLSVPFDSALPAELQARLRKTD